MKNNDDIDKVNIYPSSKFNVEKYIENDDLSVTYISKFCPNCHYNTFLKINGNTFMCMNCEKEFLKSKLYIDENGLKCEEYIKLKKQNKKLLEALQKICDKFNKEAQISNKEARKIIKKIPPWNQEDYCCGLGDAEKIAFKAIEDYKKGKTK